MTELLLTPEEIRFELVNNGIDSSPYIEAACEASNEAQLAKAEPLIRKDERERIMWLLPQITERFDHNRTCFDCIECIKRLALKEER